MPWSKGQSGNPKGRPKREFTIAEHIRKILQAKDPQLKKTYLELFSKQVVLRAINGDPTCTKLVMQYIDGLPVQKLDVQSENKGTIEIVLKKKVDKKGKND